MARCTSGPGPTPAPCAAPRAMRPVWPRSELSAYNDRVSLRGFQWRPRTCPSGQTVPGRATTGAGGTPVRRAGVRVAAGADQPVEVDAHPEVGVRNSQPEGIGRVADLGDLVAWNNLGRNVVFADRRWQPVAVFGTTSFAYDDELSQYDLDVHAILQLAEEGEGLVVTLNHLGSVLGFAAAEVALSGVPRSGPSPSEVGQARPAGDLHLVRRRSRAHRRGRCAAGQLPAGVLSRWGPAGLRAGAHRFREACPRRRGGSRRLGPGHRPLHLRHRRRPAGGGGRRRPGHTGGAGRRAVRAKAVRC